MARLQSVFSATGSYLPPLRVPNSAFLDRDFRNANGSPIGKTHAEIVGQVEGNTGIREQRYAPDDMVTWNIAFGAAMGALDSSGVDGETFACLSVAHYFC